VAATHGSDVACLRLCPVQAIVAAFGLDERTVARWQKESGLQCRRVHEHLIEAGKVALLQVQADEIRLSRRSAGSTGWPLRWRSEADCGSAGF
jgi:hypothetical protein